MLRVVGLSCAAPVDHVIVQMIVVTTTILDPIFKDVVQRSNTREKEDAAQDPIK